MAYLLAPPHRHRRDESTTHSWRGIGDKTSRASQHHTHTHSTKPNRSHTPHVNVARSRDARVHAHLSRAFPHRKDTRKSTQAVRAHERPKRTSAALSVVFVAPNTTRTTHHIALSLSLAVVSLKTRPRSSVRARFSLRDTQTRDTTTSTTVHTRTGASLYSTHNIIHHTHTSIVERTSTGD